MDDARAHRLGQGRPVSFYDGMALAAEGAMLALLVLVGWVAGPSLWLKFALAIAVPLTVGALWGIWLSHNAPKGLPGIGRLIGQIVGVVAVCGVVALVGLPWIALPAAVALIAVYLYIYGH